MLKGLIPRQRNSLRGLVYAKYRWLHMNNSIEFTLCEKKFRFASEYKSVLLTAKAEKVRELERISHAQPSVFRINSFLQGISLARNQALTPKNGLYIKLTLLKRCITYNFQDLGQRVYKERQVDKKKCKVFVTAHVVLRTAAMYLSSALIAI